MASSSQLSIKTLKGLAALASLLLISSVTAVPVNDRGYETRDVFVRNIPFPAVHAPGFARRSDLYIRVDTPPPPLATDAPIPPDSQKMTPHQAATLMRPPSPDKGALYSHTDQPKDQSASLGRDGFKKTIKQADQTHIGHALTTPSHGKLDNPKNPNTFLSTDADKSKNAKKKENEPKWDVVSDQFAHDASGRVPLHTDGSGPLHPQSVATRIEMPQVQRPDGPATGVDRTDHHAGTTSSEWNRPQPPPKTPSPPQTPSSANKHARRDAWAKVEAADSFAIFHQLGRREAVPLAGYLNYGY